MVAKIIPIEPKLEPTIGISKSATPALADIEDEGEADKPTVSLSRIEFALVFFSLFLAMFVAPLDTSIVGPALQEIFTDLGHQELLPWVGSAYTLAAAPVGIVFGKLAHLFGCKWILVFALVLFEIGSLMSAISQSMLMLILGRVITGFGAGGMATLVNIIVSEICTAKERGKYLGILGMAYGLAFLLGPVIGGVLTDHISWRWCFYINIPIGVFAIIVCIAFLRYPPKSEASVASRLQEIDFLGSAMLLVAMVLIDTPLQLGGNQWRWDSIQSIAMMVGFIAIMIAFVHLEMNVIKNPLIPRQVFVDSSILAFIFISFCIGAALFSGLYYNALFFQFTFGDSAIESGIRTYPMVIGFILLTVVSGALFSRTGHYGSFFIIGPVVWGVGMISTAFLTVDSSSFYRIVALLLLGIGCGTIMQLRVSALQNTVEPHLLFVSTGLAASIVYVGGTMAVSTTGAILDNILLAKAHTNPVLQKMTETLSGMGIEVDYQQYMTVSKLLAKLASKYPSREQEFLAARVELTGAFNEGFKAATLSQLGFMVLILFCVPFIWQRKPRQSVSD